MKYPMIYSHAAGLKNVLIDRGLSIAAGAKTAGISVDRFYSMVRRDSPITIITASKLRNTFGNDVIKLSEAAEKN